MARFERRPDLDRRACFGCGDSGPTDAWLDTLTGELSFADPRELDRALETTDERQSELDFGGPILVGELRMVRDD